MKNNSIQLITPKYLILVFLLALHFTSFLQNYKSSVFKKGSWSLATVTDLGNNETCVFYVNGSISKYTAVFLNSKNEVTTTIPLTTKFKLEGYFPSKFAVVSNKIGYAINNWNNENELLITNEQLVQISIPITETYLQNAAVLNSKIGINGNPQWLMSNCISGEIPELFFVEYDLDQKKLITTKINDIQLEKVAFKGQFICKGKDFDELYFLNYHENESQITITSILLVDYVLTVIDNEDLELRNNQMVYEIEKIDEYGASESDLVCSVNLKDKTGLISEIMFVAYNGNFVTTYFELNKILDTKNLKEMDFGVFNSTHGSYVYSRQINLTIESTVHYVFFAIPIMELNESQNWKLYKNLQGYADIDSYNSKLNADYSQIFTLPIFNLAIQSLDTSLTTENLSLAIVSINGDKIKAILEIVNSKYDQLYDVITLEPSAPEVEE